MLYAPLKLIDQMQNYFVIKNARHMEQKINSSALAWVDSRSSDTAWVAKFIHDYVTSRSYLIDNARFKASIRDFWDSERADFTKSLSDIMYNENDEDFFNQIMMSYINSAWRFHKLAYKVEPYMVNQFLHMKKPNSILLDCIRKVPSDCFYVDLSGSGDEICKDLEGFFLITNESSDGIAVELVSLIRSKSGRVMPIFTQSYIDLSEGAETDACVINDEIADIRTIPMEDGVIRCFNDRLLLIFYYNFIVYLNASNKDVEVGEVSKKIIDKPVDKSVEPKNKFREVREYKVGYKVSSVIKKESRLSGGSSSGRGSAKCSHFRSAHWHHYWTGSGENKKLIIKWLSGVWVKGKSEQPIVVVHKVK